MANIKIFAVIPETNLGHGFVFAKRQVDQLKGLGCEVQVFYLQSRTSFSSLLSDAIRFRRMIGSFKPDVVHAHYGSVVGFFATLFSSVPVVVTFRGSDLNPNPGDGYVRGFFSRLFSQLSALLASRIVCVSPGLEKRLWWRKSKSVVLPTGVSLDEFFPVDRQSARSKLNWPESSRVILFNTSFDLNPNKRLDLAEAATKLVSSRLSNVKLVVLNGGISPDMVNVYMNAADVLLMCSEYEGSPTVVQEALACNLPVCSVDVGDAAAMINSVANCVLVERKSEAIAEGLIGILDNPLRSDGRLYFSRYSSKVNTDKLVSIFSALRKNNAIKFAGEGK